MAADRDGLAMFGHPAGDALADAQLQPIDDVRMRRLRRAQDEVVAVEDIDETGVARDDARHEVDDAREHGVQRIGGRDAAADFVQKVDVVAHVRPERKRLWSDHGVPHPEDPPEGCGTVREQVIHTGATWPAQAAGTGVRRGTPGSKIHTWSAIHKGGSGNVSVNFEIS